MATTDEPLYDLESRTWDKACPCILAEQVDPDCQYHGRDARLAAALESTQAAHDDATDPRTNPCPDCEWGEVVMDGPPDRSINHQPVRCSAWCGWTA